MADSPMRLPDVVRKITYYQRLLYSQPDNADLYYNLGVLLAQQSHGPQATVCFQKAISLNPNHVLALNNLGLVFEQQGQPEQAVRIWQHILQIDPAFSPASNNLGVALAKQGKQKEAVTIFQRALQFDPDNIEVRYNLANRWRDEVELEEAAAGYKKVLALSPEHIGANNNLGLILLQQGQLNQAEAYFRQGLAFQPDDAETCYNLAVTLGRQERLETARSYFRKAIALRPTNILWQLELDLLCPAMIHSNNALNRWREHALAALQQYPSGLIDLNEQLPAVLRSNSQPPFYLHYQGYSTLEFKTRYAELFTVPENQHVHGPENRHNHKPHSKRLGFFVTVRNEKLFLKLMGGVLNNLYLEEYRLTIICWPVSIDLIASQINNPTIEFLPLAPKPQQSIQQIKAAKFDLIYFFEVGSNPVNYFFPFFRLAPVQCTSWGVTDTTGLPDMDYYLSSRYFEPDGAAAHYSEKLVCLDSLLSYFSPPALPEHLKKRTDFGLPFQRNLYVCLQNLLKFHPDFDDFLAGILRRDLQGVFVLVSREGQEWLFQRWRQRLESRFPDVIPRIIALPQQNYNDYLNLIAVADVILDTPHFSGGITSYEALACGTPLVTLPTGFMRGRMTLGCYQAMGMLDLVANNRTEYIDIAVRLATDPAYRGLIRTKILACNGVLFENEEVVRQYEQFFKQALATMKA